MDKDNLTKAREAATEKREQRISQGLAPTRTPIEKMMDNPTSLRTCVNAKCYECNGTENYVNRTRFCVVFDCPLWNVRPYSKDISQEQCVEYEEHGVESNEENSVDDLLDELDTIL